MCTFTFRVLFWALKRRRKMAILIITRNFLWKKPLDHLHFEHWRRWSRMGTFNPAEEDGPSLHNGVGVGVAGIVVAHLGRAAGSCCGCSVGTKFNSPPQTHITLTQPSCAPHFTLVQGIGWHTWPPPCAAEESRVGDIFLATDGGGLMSALRSLDEEEQVVGVLLPPSSALSVYLLRCGDRWQTHSRSATCALAFY